jgi:hypothetical protein
MPVRDGEQGSIGFQPDTDRSLRVALMRISNDVEVTQSRRSIGAGYRLEAYATLHLGLAPGRFFIAWRPVNHHPQSGRPRSHSATPDFFTYYSLLNVLRCARTLLT